MIKLETKEKFIELRAKGFSYDNIAKTLNVSKQTLIDWSISSVNFLFGIVGILSP